MLHNFSDVLSSSVSSLFNLSIRSGRLPAEWKLSHIVPIPKSTTNHDVASFQPISLLSLLSKCLERHFHKLLLKHLLTNNILSDAQYIWFRKGRSTVTPLLVIVNQWHQILENSHQAACVIFDFNKGIQ